MLKFADLFCGGGGMSLGLIASGMEDTVHRLSEHPVRRDRHQRRIDRTIVFIEAMETWLFYRFS